MPELPIGSLPIPATPLDELARWHLEIRCGRCCRRRSLMVAPLARRYGGDVRIIDVLRRLRCAARTDTGPCGGTPSHVVMAEVHVSGTTRRRLREMPVWGPADGAALPGLRNSLDSGAELGR